MSSGIRATVEFSSSAGCPIAEVSAAADATVDAVSTSVNVGGESDCVTEFAVDGGADLDPALERRLTTVFSHGTTRHYAVRHGENATCPCECLGRFGRPVNRYVARDGRLSIVFHAAEYDQLRDVIAALREEFPGVDIKRLVQSPEGDPARDAVLVERSKLTARQLEVLETAYEMGYFESPRRANATDIAAELDINPSTFRQHLSAAESKLFEDVL